MGDIQKKKGGSSVSTVKPSGGLKLSSGNIVFVVALVLFMGVQVYIHHIINLEQPTPYMDEVFHVPQTQKYCSGIFDEWDPKITTLPGTYLISSVIISAWNIILPHADPCSTYNLRLINVGFSALNIILIYYIVGKYNPDLTPLKRVVSAFNVGTFPVLYFFSFLYYTDAIATFWLLVMHALYLSELYGYSAIAGAYSVFTRQTNIVWVFYHGINSILQVLTEKLGDLIFLLPLEGKKFFLSGRPFGRPSKAKRANKGGKKANKSGRPSSNNIPSLVKIWRDCGDDFTDRGCGYMLVGLAFTIFVIYNGSIVVGDKEAHTASINIPQIMYFALVFGTFTIPFMASRVKEVGLHMLSLPKYVLYVAALFAVIIYFNTPVHPYLLADNRHYTFYVWKRFYENIPCFRYIWIPFYVMVWTLIMSAMGEQKLFVFNYVLCAVINLIPQLLLEFRYFIPAYMFARMTFRKVTWFELVLEFVMHQGFNYLTLYVFLNIPFRWADTPGVQRFMW